MGPFDVIKEQVATASDQLLRDLLRLLIEAEARQMGISLAAIAVGGNQTAADDGVDASIAWDDDPKPGGWLPRSTSFFQSKAEDMAKAKLTKEMRPKDKPRAIFDELARAGGAYIVFSTDDPSKRGYDARIAAMRAALRDVPDSDRILLDFYGADRIARWTNSHPGIAAWLLGQLGRPLGGWRPYGDWSAPDAAAKPYLQDNTARGRIDNEVVDMARAIGAMRSVLAMPRGVVRLVGASGMGKTRLAEALFDDRIDPVSSLAPSLAIYGDAGRDLGVSPALQAEQLAAAGVPAVLVVDNCVATVHGHISQLIGQANSKVSVLTIDHDTLGERPAGLLVHLQGNSDDLLSGLIEQRFPILTQAERRHLAEFSGGNARIALKLAEAGAEGVDLSKLNDSELLDRLFQTGRQVHEPHLRACAEVASLVHAFYVEPGDGHQAEHAILAELAEVSIETFYRLVATLLDWGVIQQRGSQRAVMPPPLANMLAAPRIRRSDPNALVSKFMGASSRLFASFARRIGQLHDEPAAVRIAELLLAIDGPLGAPESLDELGIQAFVRAAPAAPLAALAAIERALAGPLTERFTAPNSLARPKIAELLVHLAHSPTLFARSVEALIQFTITDGDSSDDRKAQNHLLQRFWPVLSLTLADDTARFPMIDRMLRDPDDRVHALGLEALDHMLDAGHFSSSLNLEFGARMHLTEWRPPNGLGYVAWFNAAYDRLIAVAASGRAGADRARDIVAEHFREHFTVGIPDKHLEAMQAMRANRYWERGWRAVNDALHFVRRRPDPGEESEETNDATRGEREAQHAANIAALLPLEQALRPSTIDEHFETFVLGEPWRHWHPAGRTGKMLRRVGMLARATARTLMRRKIDPTSYLARAAASEGSNSVADFMAGLARYGADPEALWQQVYQLNVAPESKVRPGMLRGILSGAREMHRDWVEAKLDGLLEDPLLADHLVDFQTVVALDATAIARFERGLRDGRLSSHRFSTLTMGGVTQTVPAAFLANLLRLLFARADGIAPAMEVLHMRLFGDRSDNIPIDPALVQLGREFLSNPRIYRAELSRIDHGAEDIGTQVLEACDGEAAARDICRAMVASAGDSYVSLHQFSKLCRLLIRSFPRVVLEEIVEKSGNAYLVDRFFGDWSQDDDDPFEPVADDLGPILDWVSEAPEARAPAIARYLPYAKKDGEQLHWSSAALRLIEIAPSPSTILSAFEHRFPTGAGWGPFSLRFVRRRPMINDLIEHGDPRVREWARGAAIRLEASIQHWDNLDLDRSSRFE